MDMHTLHIEHIMLLGIFTVLTTLNAALLRGARGSQSFTGFTMCAFLGATLITLRGQIPDMLSIGLGNAAFSVAYVFLHWSLANFFGRRRALVSVQVALATGCAAMMLWWGVLRPDTPKRLLSLSLVLAAQLTVTAWFTLREAQQPGQWPARILGGLLALLSVNNLYRAVMVVMQGAPANYLHSKGALAWVLLFTSVLQCAVAIAYVWMTAGRLREELETLANTDPLTQLANRRAIAVRAGAEMGRSADSGLPLSAILIDLDDFKTVNDRWGHHCGDAMLEAVARCLQAGMRETDLLARQGGDEFAVMLPRTSRYEALDIAERLRCDLAELDCSETGAGLVARRALAWRRCRPTRWSGRSCCSSVTRRCTR